MSSVLDLARPDLLSRRGYVAASPARNSIRLHANEAPWAIAHSDPGFGADINRYPSPVSADIVDRLCSLYGVSSGNLLITRGSDEGIDVLMRSFCQAGRDSVIVCPPTFGMYRQSAEIQGAQIIEVPLLAKQGFALNVAGILGAGEANTKLVFVCTPNNPTGNAVAIDTIRQLCRELSGRALVVVDEAYVEFTGRPGAAHLLDGLPNLVVLRTLSKAFGLAGARCGCLLADPEVVALLRSVLPPYVLPSPVVALLDAALQPASLELLANNIETLLEQRERLRAALSALDDVEKVWPSSANFLLVRFRDAASIMRRCAQYRVLLRDFSHERDLQNCIRVTVGSADDNRQLLQAITNRETPA